MVATQVKTPIEHEPKKTAFKQRMCGLNAHPIQWRDYHNNSGPCSKCGKYIERPDLKCFTCKMCKLVTCDSKHTSLLCSDCFSESLPVS